MDWQQVIVWLPVTAFIGYTVWVIMDWQVSVWLSIAAAVWYVIWIIYTNGGC